MNVKALLVTFVLVAVSMAIIYRVAALKKIVVPATA